MWPPHHHCDVTRLICAQGCLIKGLAVIFQEKNGMYGFIKPPCNTRRFIITFKIWVSMIPAKSNGMEARKLKIWTFKNTLLYSVTAYPYIKHPCLSQLCARPQCSPSCERGRCLPLSAQSRVTGPPKFHPKIEFSGDTLYTYIISIILYHCRYFYSQFFPYYIIARNRLEW